MLEKVEGTTVEFVYDGDEVTQEFGKIGKS